MGCTCTKVPKKDFKPQSYSRAAQYEVKGEVPQDFKVNAKNDNKGKEKQIGSKKGQLDRPKVLSDIYLKPYLIVEMAHKDEKKFIKVIKENGIKNLVSIVGYEANPQLILQSGRKVSTLNWNPLTFALVLGKQELYNFIAKNLNFNLKKLMEHDTPIYSQISNQPVISENKEDDTLNELFVLMIENESPFLKYILNDLCYLLKNSNLKRLINLLSRSQKPSLYLETLMQSKAMKRLYYQKVKSIIKYKDSFEMFFEKYLSNFTQNKQCLELLQKCLVKPPFNAGFGTFLLQKSAKCKDLFDQPLHELISQCSDNLKDFDVYRLGNLKESDINTLTKVDQSQFSQFIATLTQMIKNRYQMEQKIQQMLQKAFKGDLSGVKSRIGNGSGDIPKEAVTLLTGLKMETQKFKVEVLNEDFEFETEELNVIELASVMGHHKIIKYLVEELQLKSIKDFQIADKCGILDSIVFVLGPILKKDQKTMTILLQQSHLWTYEELCQMLQLMKQTKWFDGIILALSSKTAHEIFFNINLAERFRYIRDCMILPFKIDKLNESSVNMSQADMMNDSYRQSSRRFTSAQQYNLTNDEKVKLRSLIKNRLTEQPFTGAFLFQEFAQRRDTYKDETTEIIPEKPEESLNYLRQSIMNVTDMELHEYINETQGSVINALQRYVDALSINVQEQNQNANLMQEEIEGLIERIKQHPTFLMINAPVYEIINDNKV